MREEGGEEEGRKDERTRREGGREAKGVRGCWNLGRSGGKTRRGSSFFSETDSSPSSLGGRVREQPAWGVPS